MASDGKLLETVDPSDAFSPGAELWIVPALAHSQWTKKIDWKLNFQIAKSHLHKKLHLSQSLTETLEKCQIPQIPLGEVPPTLMIASHQLLPNRWLVVIEEDCKDLEYLQKAAQISQKLGVKKVRIFLSAQKDSQSSGSRNSRLRSLAPAIEFEIVQENSHDRQ